MTADPVLFVDVDGVISLFGFEHATGAPGPLPLGRRYSALHPWRLRSQARTAGASDFELVWATGWEEKANEYLPFILGLPFRDLPVLTFDGRAVFGSAHWKLDAIDEYAGDRPAAWIDDNLDDECERWAAARAREIPTLLVRTEPAMGMTDEHVKRLLAWADEVAR